MQILVSVLKKITNKPLIINYMQFQQQKYQNPNIYSRFLFNRKKLHLIDTRFIIGISMYRPIKSMNINLSHLQNTKIIRNSSLNDNLFSLISSVSFQRRKFALTLI